MVWSRAVWSIKTKNVCSLAWQKHLQRINDLIFFCPHRRKRQMDPCIASVNVFRCVKYFRTGFFMLMKEELRWSCWSFWCLCYSLRDIFHPVVTFSSFCSEQFVFWISPCCCLKKAAGASIWWISFLDGEFHDPSSSLKICEEILKVSNLTVAPTGIFCP